MGSPRRLNEVFSSIGHPVRRSNARRSAWNEGLVIESTVCGRAEPSTCVLPAAQKVIAPGTFRA